MRAGKGGMTAIIDYGRGNLFSLQNALEFLEIPCEITSDVNKIENADRIILPGVGAFGDAMQQLQARSLTSFLRRQAKEKPFLGICLGMQLLFGTGYEFGEWEGLGLLQGEVVPIEAPGLKIPHMGWNSLRYHRENPLLHGVPEGTYVYFVHSFRAKTPEENVAADCEYGEAIPALVGRGTLFGAQFHPEKSGRAGLQMLKNFSRL